MTWTVLEGDCRDVLPTLPAASVHTVITSPPYFGLRDYGTGEWEGGDSACDHVKALQHREQPDRPRGWDGAFRHTSQPQPIPYSTICGRCGARRVDQQIGLEHAPDAYVAELVAVFREVWRVLRDDGTVWLNLGDSYASKARGSDAGWQTSRLSNPGTLQKAQAAALRPSGERHRGKANGIKEKDLIGVPWLVAFALRADGWWLRADVVWSKPNPMPESMRDRPTRAHEYVFLLTKRPVYSYDADAIRERYAEGSAERIAAGFKDRYADVGVPHGGHRGAYGGPVGERINPAGRNKRSVWTVATQPYREAHFAVFPPNLIEPCLLAGSPAKACVDCGAPWERITRRQRLRNGVPVCGAYRPNRGEWRAQPGISPTGRRHSEVTEVTTVAFVPTCAHYDEHFAGMPAPRRRRKREQRAATPDRMRRVRSHANPDWPTAPGVVLDPFSGAGTTGVVAGWHGRDFIGIELNAAYAAMSRRRITRDGRPGGAPRPKPPRVAEEQIDLFVGLAGEAAA